MSRNYTLKRLLPMAHSEGYSDADTLEIYCVPFAMNPEGHNLSGHLNMSKVSYSDLTLNLRPGGAWDYDLATSETGDIYIDIWAVYYNWTQIRDGRIVNSFQ